MGWGMARLYDGAMRAEEQACLAAWRAELLGGLRGRVLEVGAGTGVNLAYYPAALDSLVLAEPDRHMRRRLAQRAAGDGRAGLTVSDAGASPLPFEDGAFDHVVSTLVLCTVTDLEGALGEIHRVLRPGGELHYLEHVGAAADSPLRRRQERWEPLWRWLNEGCCLTRDTGPAIAAAGFRLDQHTESVNTGGFAVTGPTIRGRAVRL